MPSWHFCRLCPSTQDGGVPVPPEADPGVGAGGRERVPRVTHGWAETGELAARPAARLIASQRQPCHRGVLQSGGAAGAVTAPPVPILALCALGLWGQLFQGCGSISSSKEGKGKEGP